MIGRGLCRGPDWQNGQWPHDEGYESVDQCSLECEKRPGCTGFDLTPSPDVKAKQRCILHGHDDIQVATATSLQDSKCYRMIGKKAIPGEAKVAGSKTAAKSPKVPQLKVHIRKILLIFEEAILLYCTEKQIDLT